MIARRDIFVLERAANGKYKVSVPDGARDEGLTLRQLYLLSLVAKDAHRREVRRLSGEKRRGKAEGKASTGKAPR